MLYWYILTPLHLLLHLCIYDRNFRLLSRSFFGQVLRGGSAGGRRVRWLREVVSSIGLPSIRRVGAIFILRALRAIWILSVLGRVCLPLWWDDVMMSHVASDCCYITFGPLYAREISIYFSCHILYHVVENPVANACLVCLQVVHYALLYPQLTRKC